MIRGAALATFVALLGAGAAPWWQPAAAYQDVGSSLDQIFDDPVFSRALVAARVESLRDGRMLYERNSGRLVIPASNLKLATFAVAAERLGWDFQFETRVETAGSVRNGVLSGDLVVVGSGDPSIGSGDAGHAAIFLEWADALRARGIHTIDGAVIGDDNAFDDLTLGAGWAWDYLAAGYAAPVGALNYNENVAVVRISPAGQPGAAATIALTPPGHLLDVTNDVRTGEAKDPSTVELLRLPGSSSLRLRGQLPAGSPPLIRTAALDSPTQSFVEALELALVARGIQVTQAATDIDSLKRPTSTAPRQLLARRLSAPLSSLIGYSMKESQNVYAEAIFKALGRTASEPGTAERARRVMQETLTPWGITANSMVIYDGSGLSRYNYATAESFVMILRRVWEDERLRGPFVAALPVGGHDGTLGGRMKTALSRHVQAKTGTINNVRALSGYLETKTGEKLAFSIIVNNYTATNAQVDAVVERALERLLD